MPCRSSKSPELASKKVAGSKADGISELLLARKHEIDHLRPELAVRLGLLAVLGVVDAEDLTSRDPLPRSVLVHEATDLLLGYLAPAGPPGFAEGVDFFDIWG